MAASTSGVFPAGFNVITLSPISIPLSVWGNANIRLTLSYVSPPPSPPSGSWLYGEVEDYQIDFGWADQDTV